ncbi:MAG: hypothetical protein R3B91_15325, partial [Planctomycetaceae bacterium]
STVLGVLMWGCLLSTADAAKPIRVATFNEDATPPIGAPVAYKLARSITDPLSARGIVLLSDQQPIVLCAVDWIGIANEGHDLWREKLAAAAGTTHERVSVHTLHQHDGPRCDFSSEQLLADHGEPGQWYDLAFCREVIERTAATVRSAIPRAVPVTHIGHGQALIDGVASNRRLLGPDGKVKIVRYSASKDPDAIVTPDGTIDPWLKCVSLWNGDEPIVSMTYYATHPQSYYGEGDVTSEFVGLARAAREHGQPMQLHVHFNGAGGNIAAGKYNDGSTELRPILADRLERGMQAAWEATVRSPLSNNDLEWRVVPVTLPLGDHLQADELEAVLSDKQATARDHLSAAKHLAWLQRTKAGRTIDCSSLRLGDVIIVHMPGELFVEYQLAAQQMRPDAFVCMAAYGEYGAGYIGTDFAYGQGGYETSDRATRTKAGVEPVLMNAMQQLLEK